MVLYALQQLAEGFADILFVIVLPQGSAPGFIVDAAGSIGRLAALGAGLGAWVPWTVAGVVVSAVTGVWLTIVVVAGVRWVLSWIPTMGG